MPLGEVDGAELGRTLPVFHVGAEDGTRTLSLAPDHSAHGVLRQTLNVSAAASEGTLSLFFPVTSLPLAHGTAVAGRSSSTPKPRNSPAQLGPSMSGAELEQSYGGQQRRPRRR